VGRIFAVDYAEVRLPIPNADLAFLDLPLGYEELPAAHAAPGQGPKGGVELAGPPEPGPEGPTVRLHGHYAGRDHTWRGTLVRTEGALDARTRMVQAVVRVEAPYARGEEGRRPPLPIGLFVEAEIQGRLFDDLVELPRSALREDGAVVVVDEHSRLQQRSVQVVRTDRDRVYVSGGLEAGERVATTRLEVVVEGMPVRTVARQEGEADAAPSLARAAEAARSGSAP